MYASLDDIWELHKASREKHGQRLEASQNLLHSQQGQSTVIGGNSSIAEEEEPAQQQQQQQHQQFDFLRTELDSEHRAPPTPAAPTTTVAVTSVTKKSSRTTLRSRAESLAPINLMATSSAPSKAHSSPSKASYARTYDSKLVSREMARLGGLTTQLSQATSSSTSVSTPIAQSSSTSGGKDPWEALTIVVLPLFNGEQLRVPIEGLNVLVRRHVQSVVSSAPQKALSTLEHATSELIGSGMDTINAKFNNVEDNKLLGRIVEIWIFFWGQVLPYLEGVLLPLQTDPILSGLYRKPHRGSSPTRQGGKSSASSFLSATSGSRIDVRSLVLKSFRDRVVLPLSPRLYKCLSSFNRDEETSPYQQPRLQQMLLVLASLTQRRASSLSLAVPTPQLSPGEQAITDLLQSLLSPRPGRKGRAGPTNLVGEARAPSFLSGGTPRDRRGRIAKRAKAGLALNLDLDDSSDEFSMRNGNESAAIALGRERDREILEALRSPDVDVDASDTRASIGGWGLGMGLTDSSGKLEDDEEEALSWDQAQAGLMHTAGSVSTLHSPSDLKDLRRAK